MHVAWAVLLRTHGPTGPGCGEKKETGKALTTHDERAREREREREGERNGEREVNARAAGMPELPEVEAARRALQAHCVGRRIARCAVADDDKVVVAAAGRAAFERAMVGRTIVAARRRGKNLWLQLDAPPFPSFQFG